MKNRIIFKTEAGHLVSAPIDSVVKILGEKELFSVYDDSEWKIHKDYISFVDSQLFPEEYLI